MAKASPLQSSFLAGEFSPLAQGRVDADRFKQGADTMLNWLPIEQGPAARMPGTYYAANVKNSANKARLQSFVFSETQAYILEFGNTYVRFYRNGGQILNGGVPVELNPPYTTQDVFQLKFAQSADTLYITHPNYPPAKITRQSDTAWTYTVIAFEDGPYLNNIFNSAAGGPNQIQASPIGTGAGVPFNTANTSSINNGAGFQLSDVGRSIRAVFGTKMIWGYIDGFVDSTHISVNVKFNNTGLAGSQLADSFRLGVWGNTTGYPACVCFHEDRLGFAGANNFPDRIDLSNTSDYENFEPTQSDGATVIASNAISFSFNSQELNKIYWMASDEKGLNVGTVGAEWNVRPSSLGEALTPTNVTAKKTTSYGSANVQPVQIGKATMFLQRGARKLREMVFFYDVEGFRANNMTVLSEHITGPAPGIVQMALMKVPFQFVVCVRSDGQVALMNYERDADSLKAGWARAQLGDGGAPLPAAVESVAVIPSQDGTYDQIWFVVNRWVNGAVVRMVEYTTKMFEATDKQRDANYMNASLKYDQPLPITNITAANPPVVTCTGHGLSTGNTIRIDDVVGLAGPPGANIAGAVNDISFTITVIDANTFSLNSQNFTGFALYFSGGEARKEITSVSGLSYLNTLTVGIYADGAPLPPQVVVAGVINLPQKCTVVSIGLLYNSDLRLLRPDVGATDGTAHGKLRRVNRIGIDYFNTLGLQIGDDFSDLDTIEMKSKEDVMGRAPTLKTAIDVFEIEMDYDRENKVCIRVSDPVPATILAVMPWVEEDDAA